MSPEGTLMAETFIQERCGDRNYCGISYFIKLLKIRGNKTLFGGEA